MHISRQSILLWVILAIGFLSPVVVGAFPGRKATLVAGALFVFAAYALGLARARLPKQIALVLFSFCFAVTLFDLSARPILFYFFESRPGQRFIYRWPPLPQLQRYVADINFDGTTYGDLAAMSGRSDWREPRRFKFVTDAYGFRNEPAGADKEARPLDVIVLGDSFGVAGSTSQEKTLSCLLARNFGLSVYNLSVSGANPQQEWANLLLESPRLPTRDGTFVLWLIFPGNDLDEQYYAELENPQPRWPSLLKRLSDGFSDFSSRSPVHRLFSRGDSQMVIERKFVDGRPLLFFAPYAQRGSRTAEDVRRHPNFQSLKATFEAMKRLTVARHLAVAVALVPSKEEVYSWVLDAAPPWSATEQPSGFSEVLRSLCEQHGFRFLDLKPVLVEASRQTYDKSGALLWWRDDTHWNGEGQRVAAAPVYENLLRGIQTR